MPQHLQLQNLAELEIGQDSPALDSQMKRMDAMTSMLKNVSEAHGLSHAEVLRSSASGMVLCAANYCLGKETEDFAADSSSFTFPLQVGIPGRVCANSRVEWHANVRELPAHAYLRRSLAERAGFRGVVAMPLSLSGEFSLAPDGQDSEVLASGQFVRASSSKHSASSFVLIFYSPAVLSEPEVEAIVVSVAQHSQALLSLVDSACHAVIHPPKTPPSSRQVPGTSACSPGPTTSSTPQGGEPAVREEHPRVLVGEEEGLCGFGAELMVSAPVEEKASAPVGEERRVRVPTGAARLDFADDIPALAALSCASPQRQPRRLAVPMPGEERGSWYGSGESRGGAAQGQMAQGRHCIATCGAESGRQRSLASLVAEAGREEGAARMGSGSSSGSTYSGSSGRGEGLEAEEMLRVIGEECGLALCEGFRRRRSAGGMRRLEACFCRGPTHQAFHAGSQAFAFPSDLTQSLPGRVLQKRRIEWYSDLRTLPADRFLRWALAQAAGLRGVLAVPLGLPGSVDVVVCYFDRAIENADVYSVLALASSILQCFRIARHPKRLGGQAKPCSTGASEALPRRMRASASATNLALAAPGSPRIAPPGLRGSASSSSLSTLIQSTSMSSFPDLHLSRPDSGASQQSSTGCGDFAAAGSDRRGDDSSAPPCL